MRPRNISSPKVGIQLPPVSVPPLPPYVPDKNLTFFREGMRWTFSGGKILMDGKDVNQLLASHPSDTAYWMGIAEGLNEYRKQVTTASRKVDQFTRFEAVIEAILGKILTLMKKIYDQKMSGISWTLKNGQLILNGINIRSFLALYRIRKTEKAKKFMKGLKGKLAEILQNPRQSPDNEKIHELVEILYHEMEEELSSSEEETHRHHRRLLAPSSRVS